MDKKAREAYYYYKQQSPDTVIMFRMEDGYLLLSDDAECVVNYFPGLKLEHSKYGMTSLKLPIADILERVSALASHNIGARLVEYRNDEGQLDIPDVQCLEKNKAADY